MNEQYDITTKPATLYQIRPKKGSGWANITIYEHQSKLNGGDLSIQSDWGDWQYRWNNCGESFKEFLCGINLDYMAGKFGVDKHFDFEATVRNWRQQVDDNEDYWDDDTFILRVRMDINSIEPSTKDGVIHQVYNCNALMDFHGGTPDLCYVIQPQFLTFWNGIWQGFIEHLKEEKS